MDGWVPLPHSHEGLRGIQTRGGRSRTARRLPPPSPAPSPFHNSPPEISKFEFEFEFEPELQPRSRFSFFSGLPRLGVYSC